MGCECRGTSLVESFDWPTEAVAIASVPFLKAPSRHSHSCRLAPGENLIFADRAVAAFHGRILLGGTTLEAWLRFGPVHLSIGSRRGGVSVPATIVSCLGCVRCVHCSVSRLYSVMFAL